MSGGKREGRERHQARIVEQGGREIPIPVDVAYLGRRLPGNPRERAILIESLLEMVEEEGAEWVWNSRERLLWEAQVCVDGGVL